MPWYIQRIDSSMVLETVDECPTAKEAHNLVREYNIADPLARHYVSKRPCKAWRESK